jgi:sodium-dependent dicarboxylate transporter 2/3/5
MKSLGPMKRVEKVVLIVFLLTAIAFISRKWVAEWTGLAISDTTIAIFAAIILFTLPLSFSKNEFILDWENAKKLPWGVLLIFGGGLAIAGAFKSTGLAEAIGNGLDHFSGINPLFLVIIITIVVVFLTELTSNTATTAIFLPIMGAVAIGLDYDPLLLLIPVTMAASMAFMMPIATPPNAVVFAYDDLKVHDMARTGIWLNLMAIVIIIVFVYFLAPFTLGFTLP